MKASTNTTCARGSACTTTAAAPSPTSATSKTISAKASAFRSAKATTRCYKQIERELYVVFRRGRLTVLADDGSPGSEQFCYDSHTGLLRAGTLGLFEAEDEVLRRAACETDFNRFPYDEI